GQGARGGGKGRARTSAPASSKNASPPSTTRTAARFTATPRRRDRGLRRRGGCWLATLAGRTILPRHLGHSASGSSLGELGEVRPPQRSQHEWIGTVGLPCGRCHPSPDLSTRPPWAGTLSPAPLARTWQEKRVLVVAGRSNLGLSRLDHIDNVDLDELTVERLGRRRDVGHDEFGEVRDQSAILPVAEKGHRGPSVDLDGLGVVDLEDAVADLVLTVEEVVPSRRRDGDLVDVVGAVVGLAADVEVVPVHLAALVHHRLDHAAEPQGHLVAFPLRPAELLLGGEVVRLLRVTLDQPRGTVRPRPGVFRHSVLAGE